MYTRLPRSTAKGITAEYGQPVDQNLDLAES